MSRVACHNIFMKKICPAALAAILAAATALPAAASSFDQLAGSAGGVSSAAGDVPEVHFAPASSGQFFEAQQYIPPDNDNPGFNWPRHGGRGSEGDFVRIGAAPTFLKASPALSDDLAEGTGKCALAASVAYKTVKKPGFEGDHMLVELAEPLPGCSFTRGYVYMPHVACSSAGGLCELPKTVRAFMDTLAYAEGTKEHYNYIFTFVTFTSYADHPRRAICSGSLCSTAAGRYQFLSKTWDSLAGSLGLADFTPPNQEKAGLELIRRAGAYNYALKADTYANFSAGVKKINTIWASLPGSPYGQPTHTMKELWGVYKEALAKY